jgi:hypothetical protein
VLYKRDAEMEPVANSERKEETAGDEFAFSRNRNTRIN